MELMMKLEYVEQFELLYFTFLYCKATTSWMFLSSTSVTFIDHVKKRVIIVKHRHPLT